MRALREHAPSVLLVVLVLLFVAYPVADRFQPPGMRFVLDSLFLLVLFAALFAGRGRIDWRHVGVWVVLVVGGLRFVGSLVDAGTEEARVLTVVAEIATALLLFRFCYELLRGLTRAPRVTADTIAGAAAVYILLAFAFTGLHVSTFLLEPPGEGFNGVTPASGDALRAIRPSFTYYSIVTQTTLGYGDITPRSPIARGLAAMQTVIGQLFLAILLARLVAMELAQRARRDDD